MKQNVVAEMLNESLGSPREKHLFSSICHWFFKDYRSHDRAKHISSNSIDWIWAKRGSENLEKSQSSFHRIFTVIPAWSHGDLFVVSSGKKNLVIFFRFWTFRISRVFWPPPSDEKFTFLQKKVKQKVKFLIEKLKKSKKN